VKDCIHWLSACNLCRDLERRENFVFLTSKTEDFKDKNQVEPQILSDCNTFGIHITFNYEHAFHLLK